jgi:hypothetical protein
MLKNRIPKERLSREYAYAIACAETSDSSFIESPCSSSNSSVNVEALLKVGCNLRSKISKRIAEGDEVTVVSDIVVLSCRRVRCCAPSRDLYDFRSLRARIQIAPRDQSSIGMILVLSFDRTQIFARIARRAIGHQWCRINYAVGHPTCKNDVWLLIVCHLLMTCRFSTSFCFACQVSSLRSWRSCCPYLKIPHQFSHRKVDS